jgi:peptidoglycan/xylan/chitin deacetylase (PgdA/CDA1 family)
MTRNKAESDILMYHSISDGDGPISIGPSTFRDQMAILADCGRYGISLREYAAWRRGAVELRHNFVVLTFDDGYEDFACHAYEELAARNWTATVFIPAGKIGSVNDWEPGGARRLRLMDSRTVGQLARAGMEFGAHGITHRDLTALPAAAARDEIAGSRTTLEDCIGVPVTSFAPPYGRSNPWLRDEISRHYLCSAGTSLRRAGGDADLFDLPRIEMWYFRNPTRWRNFLQRGATPYFIARRLLRWTRTRHLWTRR